MSNFMSYENAQNVLGEFAEAIKSGGGGGGDTTSLLTVTFDDEFVGASYIVQAVGGDNETYTGTVPADKKIVLHIKQCNVVYNVSASYSNSTYTNEIAVGQYYGVYEMHLYVYHIYGARWTSDPSPVWERTDEAANFTDPVPYAPDVTNYGSPFDNIYPWSEMTKHDDFYTGLIVTMPKFYYDLAEYGNGGLWIRISDKPIAGFGISPAHRKHYTPDDSDIEKNVVCVGRYMACSTGRSDTNSTVLYNSSYYDVWDKIAKLHPDVWGMDFDTLFSLWLLFLVEFANWNSIGVVGDGTNDSSTGATDSMPYHTGTMGTNLGVQYRNIEGLWSRYLKPNLTNILFIAGTTSVKANGYIFDRLSTRTNDIHSLAFDPEWVYSIGPVTDGTWGTSAQYPTTFKVVNTPYKFFLPYEKGGSSSTYTCFDMSPRNSIASDGVSPASIMGIKQLGGLFSLSDISATSPSRPIKLSEPEEPISN